MALSVDITKHLDGFDLHVSFVVEKSNEVLALLGPSGCGKSMTLKCIAGIVKPDSGRIVLNDRVLFDFEAHINLPPQERHVGYLFQNYALFPHMSVMQNVLVGAKEETRAEREACAIEQLKKVFLIVALMSFLVASNSAAPWLVFLQASLILFCLMSLSRHLIVISDGNLNWS